MNADQKIAEVAELKIYERVALTDKKKKAKVLFFRSPDHQIARSPDLFNPCYNRVNNTSEKFG